MENLFSICGECSIGFSHMEPGSGACSGCLEPICGDPECWQSHNQDCDAIDPMDLMF